MLVPWYYMRCMCAKSLQSCLTLSDPMYCSPPGSSVHWILQARILEWIVMPSSRGSSWPEIEPEAPAVPALQADSLSLSHQGSPDTKDQNHTFVPQIDEKGKWHISQLWSINRKSMLTHGQKSCLFHKCVLT